MASKGFLHPIAAQGYGVVSPAKAKAVRAAKEMQESIEKAKLRGGQDPPFEFVELIGKGGFGRVFKAQDLQTNQMVAVKVIDLDATDITAHHRYREDTLVDFLKEIEILRTLRETNARNVNMIFDAFAVNSGVWIMKASPSPGLAEKYVIPIAREVAEGLKWVHSVGIIHRDIKAENLLVAEDGRVQLCDFGISALLESHSNKRTTIQGTPWHMPPEMLEGMFNPMLRVQYGAEIDIWAYGCTLYQIATGASPNNTVGGNDLIAAVKANLPQLHGAKFSANLCDLVSYCLKPSPTERPPIESVQQHYCLFNSARRYPTSLLRELLEDFTIWEQSGGQRNSLYVQSGAAVSADAPIDPEDEPWNFSTTEDFEKSVEAKRVSVLGPSAPSILESQQTSEEDVQNRTITAARPKEHRRIPLLPLERLFVKDDNYNYVERDKPSFTAQPSSDLPLRSQNQNSSIRDTMIDLGEFDAGSGTARIPALDTIRANKVQAPSFNSLEGDNRTPSPTEPQEEPSRRDTLAWTFPTTVIQKSDPKKLDTVQETEAAQRSVEQTAKGDTDRAQLDWKFPDLDKASSIPNVVVAPDVDQLDVPGKENDRRATMEWSLAAALSESKAAKQADLSSTHRSSITSRHRQQQRPKPLHSVTGPVPTTLTNQPLQESVSAPVSPPRGSVIYLDDYLPRPSTTEPTALPASSTVDPDDPFGIEIGSDLGRSNRSSSHRQSKSDSTLGVPTTESGLLPWEQQHQRQSSRLNEQLSPDSDQEPHVFDARAKQEWKQDFYKQWKDHAAFNPVSTDTKVSKGSHLWDRPDEEKHGMTTHDRPLPLLPSQPRSGEADDPTNRSGSISSSDHEPTPLPDQSELDRYLAQPAPAPPSAAAMADDADPQELVSELERMLGGFQEGLGVFGRAIETEEERRQRLNGLDGDDDE
ncbi:MAG: hypothetical protein M1817_005036 [Caeruleum heppii]|nr:MAG: hypothetical protein M1817_005036 [Caeruleum heppii]